MASTSSKNQMQHVCVWYGSKKWLEMMRKNLKGLLLKLLTLSPVNNISINVHAEQIFPTATGESSLLAKRSFILNEGSLGNPEREDAML